MAANPDLDYDEAGWLNLAVLDSTASPSESLEAACQTAMTDPNGLGLHRFPLSSPRVLSRSLLPASPSTSSPVVPRVCPHSCIKTDTWCSSGFCYPKVVLA